jgi:hypothetical protein
MVHEQGLVPWPVVVLNVSSQGFSTRFHCRYVTKETHCLVELKELHPLEWGEKFADRKLEVYSNTYYFTLAFWEAKKLAMDSKQEHRPISGGA